MPKRYLAILFTLVSLLPVRADITKLLLKSGATIEGEILFQNEQVVIIRDSSGKRYQYPTEEIKQEQKTSEELTEQSAQEQYKAEKIDQTDDKSYAQKSGKKVGLQLQLVGGMNFVPAYNAGGELSTKLFVGACNVLQKKIFIGGGVGYKGLYMPNKVYTFIPIEVYFSAPLTQKRHAPLLGATLGYGFNTLKNYKGGITAGVDVAYRYELNSKSAVVAGLTAEVQQASVQVTEQIVNKQYTEVLPRLLSTIALKMALQF